MNGRPEAPIDRIEQEIAHTRAQLSNSADALAAELAPTRFVKKGTGVINRFIRRSSDPNVGGVRADPVALGLIGLGVTWLLAENRNFFGGHITNRADGTPLPATPTTDATSIGGNVRFHQAAWAARQTSHLDSGAASAGQALDFTPGSVVSRAPARKADGRGSEIRKGNPLLLGLVGFAVGVVIAMLVPTSRRERELAAQAHDNLWDKAEALGHVAANSVREMAVKSPPASIDR